MLVSVFFQKGIDQQLTSNFYVSEMTFADAAVEVWLFVIVPLVVLGSWQPLKAAMDIYIGCSRRSSIFSRYDRIDIEHFQGDTPIRYRHRMSTYTSRCRYFHSRAPCFSHPSPSVLFLAPIVILYFPPTSPPLCYSSFRPPLCHSLTPPLAHHTPTTQSGQTSPAVFPVVHHA